MQCGYALSALHIRSTYLGSENMNIIAGKDGVNVSFLLCTTANAGALTENVHGLVIYTPLKKKKSLLSL